VATNATFTEHGIYGCSSPEHWTRSDGVKVLQASLKETNGLRLGTMQSSWLRWCTAVGMRLDLGQDIWAREAMLFIPTPA
jgi:hypothetical protein